MLWMMLQDDDKLYVALLAANLGCHNFDLERLASQKSLEADASTRM